MDNATEQDKLIRDLDWNLLRTFMVIVQEGSITLAAQRLMRRQPSVSQALKRLETRLGMPLIDRSPSHFRITPAGQTLYQECLDMFGSLARAIQSAQGTEDIVTGTVKLALLSRIESDFFDAILADFHLQFPEVSFDIEVMSSKAVRQAVLEKSATLGVCLVHDTHPSLQHEVLYRSYFGFYCGPSHPLFGQRDLKLDDLRDHSSVSFRTDQLWDALRPVALLRAQHKLDNKVIGYTSDLGEAQRMIGAGLGFGPLPVHIAERFVNRGELWRLPPYENALAIDIHLVHHKSARLNRAEKALLDMFRNRLASVPLEQRSYNPAETIEPRVQEG
ncbi:MULTISPECIES: LysR family transcriptional regulator [unclassified Ruegeria]|uniref:LysR family transcriptional regulator n=1 Tax=unclassified Ruegeria TaxID=2625375 RepID=UPI001487C8C0|nr:MULTISPECIES: LysR family transcriptional regulator [unclassified Ruegeria]NOE36347.1 LysR family transcriptional regulator [Ruegeria sp. HKCCD7318]